MATIITREVGATAKGSPLSNIEIDNNIINLNTDIATRIPASEKGSVNGVATLDGTGKVPSTQLPSYVDDVVEAANLAAFSATGETGKIYVALDTNKTYRWSGTTYVYITSGAVDSVAGKTGVVTLVAGDVGLGNVENKSSATIRGEITSGNVTSALGFTPYNATNPSGYTTNTGTVTAISGTAPIVSSGGTAPAISISAATTSAAGSMSAADKTKLDNIANGAQVNTVTSVAGKTGVVALAKADVGLDNVDNTSDAAKPVSTAQQTALDLKANLNSPTFTGTVAGITKAMVGLGDVENKSSATIRAELTNSNVTTALGFTPYSATNPDGYITNIKTINGDSLLGSGDLIIESGGGGGGSPGGATTQVQYNNDGAFAGSANLTFDGTTLSTTGNITITGASALRGSYGGGGDSTNFAAGDNALLSNQGGWMINGSRNVAVGVSALYANTTGSDNTSIGYLSLRYNTTGYSNTASGAYALYSNTTGNGNTANGYFALNYNTTGFWNTANGVEALRNNTAGLGNSASGYQSLRANTTGSGNTASGTYALLSNTTGNGNTASGIEALKSNTTGTSNCAFGDSSLKTNTTGYQNTAIGNGSLKANSTGNQNTASGVLALTTNTTGTGNTAAGDGALNKNTTGNYNTACGLAALYNNTTGSFNSAIGKSSLNGNTTGSGNTSINPLTSGGSTAPVFNPTTENDRFCMGSTSVTNAYIQVAWTVVSDARDKTDFALVPHGLDFVSKLQPTAYRYKMNRSDTEGHGPVRYGFKAQDVLALEGDTPVIVDAEDLDKLRFNDQALIAVLVNAIKELNAKFDAYVSTHP